MLFPILSLLAVRALADHLNIPDDNRMVQGDGLLRFPIRVSEAVPIVKGATKRQDDADLQSQRNGYLYTIDLTLGTPGQPVSLNFDTGSAELWVNPVCSQSNNPTFCETFPRFKNSSTLQNLGTETRLNYGSGYADINYVQDYVSLGSAKVKQQIFGVAYDSSTISVGVFGAGPPLDGWKTEYPTIFDNLVNQGLMNSRAYSLDIRSIESHRGSVVFGGIDTRKFSGPLEKLSVVPAEESPDQNTRWWVNLDGVALTMSNGTKIPVFSKGSQPVLLDSGYTVNALPEAIFQPLLNAFPTVKNTPDSTLYQVDCNVENITGSVDFTFGQTTVNVPYRDFIWKQPSGKCILGAFQDDNLPVLGDTFLRAAYVVYDWDNRMVHIANNEDCGSKLIPIGSGADAVPSVVGECGSSATSTTSQ